MNLLTYICCTIIIIAFLVALFYIRKVRSDDIKRKRNWMEQLPSLISTLGVVGTFVGITAGLIAFNPNNLDASIPELLQGLKTAFFTSLLGMIGSIWLNRVLSKKLSHENPEFDLRQAVQLIVDTLNNNHTSLLSVVKSPVDSEDEIESLYPVVRQIKNDLARIRELMVSVWSIQNDIEQLKGLLTSAAQIKENLEQLQSLRLDTEQVKDDVEEIKGIFQDMLTATQSINRDQEKARAVLMTATASVTVMDNNLEEIKNKLDGIASREENQNSLN
ncbi:MAG: hypothetical protein K2K26_12030 [Muribaculaceae bacterium]|nr:hypothetical protein [Muribaculaceae bacterium]